MKRSVCRLCGVWMDRHWWQASICQGAEVPHCLWRQVEPVLWAKGASVAEVEEARLLHQQHFGL